MKSIIATVAALVVSGVAVATLAQPAEARGPENELRIHNANGLRITAANGL